MTNEEAKVFLDNLKICINEHPIVADWLVEIENRNDEPSNSENPNNCEPQTYITEDRDTQILDAWQVHHRNTTSVEDEPQMAEDIVRSFGFKVESYRQAKAKDEPQTDCPQSNICGKPCKECGACEEECGLWKKLSCPSRATEEQEELNL